MNKHSSILNNENGSAVVVALLILTVLTIIGISSTNNTIIELDIVRNEQIYQTNFYQAESSAYEAIYRIEFEPNDFNLIAEDTSLDWMNDDTLDFFNSAIWLDDNSDVSLTDPSAFYSAAARGVRKGSSLSLGSSRLYEFAVFGLSQWNTGSVIVEMGYLKRF